jgi:non-ribosomal peptide synthetase component F
VRRYDGLLRWEAFPRDLAAQMLDRHVEVWNLYGPTETTVWSSVHPISHPVHNESYEPHESIGRPIDNTRLYVVGSPSPSGSLGVPGEC